MGKTNKPLKLLITTKALYDTPEVSALIEQGHRIACAEAFVPGLSGVGFELNPIGWDAVLGPNCWRMLDLEYLDVTIAAIRKEVYDSTTKPTRTDTDSKLVTKRNSRKPKR